MKKTLSIILAVILSLGMLAGCTTQKEQENNEEITSVEENANVVYPLPETLNVEALDNCTVPVSLEKGSAYVDDSGKMVMDVTVYSYEVYDMVDIASLKENDTIVRKNEEVKITEIERLDTGLVRINGGEENGGFDLASNDSGVYYEIGMNDIKAYYELGKATIPVSDEFEFVDESDIEADAKQYFAGDLLTESEIVYDFTPYNTSIVIENGTVIKMNKVYMP